MSPNLSIGALCIKMLPTVIQNYHTTCLFSIVWKQEINFREHYMVCPFCSRMHLGKWMTYSCSKLIFMLKTGGIYTCELELLTKLCDHLKSVVFSDHAAAMCTSGFGAK